MMEPNTTTTDLAVIAPQSMSAAPAMVLQAAPMSDLVSCAIAIQEAMRQVMRDGVHYGVVPGCGDKKTLLKPGAECLCALFRLVTDYDVLDLSTPDAIHYRITCRLAAASTGMYLGSGIGECTSREEKYAWRDVICREEFETTPEADRRVKYIRFKGSVRDVNGVPHTTKQVRRNHWDLSNTILKMAKKRAHVDAVLTVTAASDMFAQDLEDLEQYAPDALPVPDVATAEVTTEVATAAVPDTSINHPAVQVNEILDMVAALQIQPEEFRVAAGFPINAIDHQPPSVVADLYRRIAAIYNSSGLAQ